MTIKKTIGPADWTIAKRIGNTANTDLCEQHNSMVAGVGRPAINTWSPRRVSVSGSIVWAQRWFVPPVPQMKLIITYEYNGVTGDGGTIDVKWDDPALSGLADLDSIALVGGSVFTAYEANVNIEGEGGPGYYFALEVTLAAGKRVDIIAVMLCTNEGAPALHESAAGVRLIEAGEYADDQPLHVDLMDRLVSAPRELLDFQSSTVFQFQGEDVNAAYVRGNLYPASWTAFKRAWRDVPFRISGESKGLTMLVHGYKLGAPDAYVQAIIDDAIELRCDITAVAFQTWLVGWVGDTSAALKEGWHSVYINVSPPAAGSLIIQGITLYEEEV